MNNITHVRKGKLIQDMDTRDIQVFASINAAKRHSREHHHDSRSLKVVGNLLPPLE